MHEERMKLFAEVYSSCEGREAIHVERPGGILHVRISEVSFDSEGVKAKSTDLLTPGMDRSPRNPFEFGAAWECFSHWQDTWDVPNFLGYRLTVYFDPAVVKAMVEIAGEAARKDSTIDFKEAKEWLSAYHWTRDRLRTP